MDKSDHRILKSMLGSRYLWKPQCRVDKLKPGTLRELVAVG